MEDSLKKINSMLNSTFIDSTLLAVLIGVVTALLHGNFQVSVSVLTLLSGHSLGAKKAHTRLLALNLSYIAGVVLTVTGVLLGVISLVHSIGGVTQDVWIVAIALCAAIGSITSIAYYQGKRGTVLWLPRPIAEYLSVRAKKTRRAIEAAALGGMTVIAELPFTIAPLAVAGVLIADHAATADLVWSSLYALVASLPLIVITVLLGAGHALSRIQRWREQNKIFLQYSSGIGLVVLALYVVVFHLGDRLP